MFQYALYEKLKTSCTGNVVKADITSYRTQLPHNGYELEKIFSIDDLEYATDKEIYMSILAVQSQ
jgi:hypothetical protein